MKLVLDTSALWDARLREALVEARAVGATQDGRISVILPVVAYAERVRQLRRDGRDISWLRSGLETMGVVVEPMDDAAAERVSEIEVDEASWRRHARDALIAAHVTPGRAAVTTDRGPVWDEVHTLTPAEAAQAVRALLDPA